MNVPSVAVRTRSSAGLYVIVSVTVEIRDALLIDSGTLYGPPPTRNSVPGGVVMTWARVAAGDVPGGVVRAGGAAGGVAGAPPTGAGVTPDGCGNGAPGARICGCMTGGIAGG